MVYYKIVCDDELYDSRTCESTSEAWADFYERKGGKNGIIVTGTSFNAASIMRANRPNGSRTNDGMGRFGEIPDLVWDGLMP